MSNTIVQYLSCSLTPRSFSLIEICLIHFFSKLVFYLPHNMASEAAKKKTDEAVHKLVTSVVANSDGKRKYPMVFSDLAKAFDTVYVPILINGLLLHLNITGISKTLLVDYFFDRKQSVRIGDRTRTRNCQFWCSKLMYYCFNSLSSVH